MVTFIGFFFKSIWALMNVTFLVFILLILWVIVFYVYLGIRSLVGGAVEGSRGPVRGEAQTLAEYRAKKSP